MKKITFLQISLTIAIAFCFLITSNSYAQVGIGTTLPDASAVLDVNSTTAGLLIPKMTQVQRDAITSPATGLLIFQTNATAGFYYYNGSAWVPFGGFSGDHWDLSGNTTAVANWLGTINANDLNFRTTNLERMSVLADGRVIVNSLGGPYSAGDQFTAEGTFAVNGYTTNGSGIFGQASTVGDGVVGLALDTGFGVNGQSANAAGVLGFSTNWIGVFGDGANVGVLGDVTAAGGAGVGVQGQATSGAGVFGIVDSGDGVFGLSTSGNGVIGAASDNAGFGGNFTNSGALSHGLIAAGNNLPTSIIPASGAGITGSGETYGIAGFSNNASSTGLIGAANGITSFSTIAPNGSGVAGTGTNVGVAGFSTNTTGLGVIGLGGNINGGVGVQGQGADGVIGISSLPVTNWGVLAIGDLGATGGKFFVIDHPLDPANKILKHANIESDEILNLYRGMEVFDSNGKAIVKLPKYYSAININESYQLTPIGASMPNLYIEKEVENGMFIIAGGVSGKKVSWQLTAERNDPYLQKYPQKRNMEIDKGVNRGKYLMPELYGKSNSFAIYKKAKMQSSKTTKVLRTKPLNEKVKEVTNYESSSPSTSEKKMTKKTLSRKKR